MTKTPRALLPRVRRTALLNRDSRQTVCQAPQNPSVINILTAARSSPIWWGDAYFLERADWRSNAYATHESLPPRTFLSLLSLLSGVRFAGGRRLSARRLQVWNIAGEVDAARGVREQVFESHSRLRKERYVVRD